MSEPQVITPDHVRTLLSAADGATTLALIEGRIEILSPDQLGTEHFAGALEVMSQADLTGRLGSRPSDVEIVNEADALTAAVQQIGG